VSKIIQHVIAAAGICLLVSASSVGGAQAAKSTRIRAQIERVDGNILLVKARNGAKLTIKMADNYRIAAMIKATLAELKPNTYIGITAMPLPDGGQRAIAIHIFQPKQRGTGEGHKPWDLMPGSTMTNAAIDTTVAGTDGQVLIVKYKQGSKVETRRFIVTPQTVIVRYVPGDKKELKPGIHIIVGRATMQEDGTYTAPSLNYGRGGIIPPM
jgi:hypothetical protein